MQFRNMLRLTFKLENDLEYSHIRNHLYNIKHGKYLKLLFKTIFKLNIELKILKQII